MEALFSQLPLFFPPCVHTLAARCCRLKSQRLIICRSTWWCHGNPALTTNDGGYGNTISESLVSMKELVASKGGNLASTRWFLSHQSKECILEKCQPPHPQAKVKGEVTAGWELWNQKRSRASTRRWPPLWFTPTCEDIGETTKPKPRTMRNWSRSEILTMALQSCSLHSPPQAWTSVDGTSDISTTDPIGDQKSEYCTRNATCCSQQQILDIPIFHHHMPHTKEQTGPNFFRSCPEDTDHLWKITGSIWCLLAIGLLRHRTWNMTLEYTTYITHIIT